MGDYRKQLLQKRQLRSLALFSDYSRAHEPQPQQGLIEPDPYELYKPQPQQQPQQGLIEPDPYELLYKFTMAVIMRSRELHKLMWVPDLYGKYHIDDSPNPYEAIRIIGETQSKFDDDLIPFHKFKDGSTSYALVLDPGRVAEGSGGQYHDPLIVGDGQARHCNCHWCRLLHSELPAAQDLSTSSKRAPHHNLLWRNSSAGGNRGPNGGNQLRGLDSPSSDYGFSLIKPLKGHQKDIMAIALPSGSGKLYSGSKDKTVMVWDCQTGQCVTTANLGREVGCMISEGPWLFVGIPDSIKVWNTHTGAEMSLSCPTGQVYALVAANDMLFAGTEDGSILVWRYSAPTNCFVPAASLTGHHLAVIALVVGGTKLYSGSSDHTIKAWDLTTLQCVQTLPDHTNVVMSLLCWEQFLISCSLDNTVKFWSTNNKEQLEVTYTHNEEHGVLALCGMHDLQGKTVLLCSLNDNSVRLYDLPSFNERGRIFAKQEVRTMQAGPCGIFFTGDGTGEMKVWQWST